MPALPRPRAAIAAVALAVLPRAAHAQPADLGWRSRATVLARENPVALAADVELRHRWRLHGATHPLLAGNHVQLAGGATVTPVSLGPAVRVELQPLSILTLGAAYEPILYFGAGGQARSFPSPRARLGGGAFRPVVEGNGGAYSLVVHRFTLRAALQARAGAFAVRAAAAASRVEADLRGDDRVLYEPGQDILVYRRGWVLQGDLDLLWLAGDRLAAGARGTLVTAFYPPDAFAAGDRRDLHERTTLRVGPVARVALFRGRGGLWDEGHLLAGCQWWLAHPDRAGGSSPAVVPTAMVAFQVSGGPPGLGGGATRPSTAAPSP
jgi:hypothetical protein